MATPTVDPQIKLPQLPTRELGFENVPAFPIDTAGMLDTLFRLSIRFKQREQALEGLSKTYTIGGKTARARDFLFGHESLDAKEAAQLEHLRGLLKGNTLEIVPTIVESIASQTESKATPGGELTTLRARRSAAVVDLLDHVPRRPVPGRAAPGRVGGDGGRDAARQGHRGVLADDRHLRPLLQPAPAPEGARRREWRELFGGAWTPALDAAADAGTLYVIDLRIYEDAASPRWSPASPASRRAPSS